MVDPKLKGEYSQEQMVRVITIALLCVKASPSQRPSMTQIVSMLTSNSEITDQPTKPAFLESNVNDRTPTSSSRDSAGSHGSVNGNPGQARIGCVVHNWEGKEIASLASLDGINTNNWAELMALVEGFLLCRKLEAKCLDIEGDLAIVVNALRKGSMPNWKLNTLLSKAIDLCKSLDRFTVNHIYREGNKRVDELANLGADGIKLLSMPT
ncbi:uncharacterized protein LOC131875919 [Cryptomeria japonica]|uniref:uncharacterized protein LOC131875919 n=1 Tax=Cryptomeria japonica TaxID=3369 RepID=UPI0027DA4F9F|nr:uncharacterized protein LOC131875919 [Cryptomeria japonica]